MLFIIEVMQKNDIFFGLHCIFEVIALLGYMG